MRLTVRGGRSDNRVEMKKNIAIAFLLLGAALGMAWGKVSFDGRVDSMKNIITPSFGLYVEEMSDDNRSSHTIYYPFINCTTTGDTEDAESFTLVQNPKNNAPCRTGENLEGQVLISVTSSTNGSIYGAFETAIPDTFEVIQIQEKGHAGLANQIAISQGQAKSIRVDLGSVCRHSSCIFPGNDSAILSRRLLIFHSSSEGAPSTGNTLTLGDPHFESGEIYNLQIARKLPSTSYRNELPNYSIFKGDTQVFISYDATGLSMKAQDIRALRVTIYPSFQERNVKYCDTQDNQDCDQLCGTETDCPLYRLEESLEEEEAEVVLSSLKNGVPINLSVCIENKWGFCSLFPPSQTTTPQSLETFLQEQSCFFFSAGFGQQHYVIERLKWFRDHILRKLPGGKDIH